MEYSPNSSRTKDNGGILMAPLKKVKGRRGNKNQHFAVSMTKREAGTIRIAIKKLENITERMKDGRASTFLTDNLNNAIDNLQFALKKNDR